MTGRPERGETRSETTNAADPLIYKGEPLGVVELAPALSKDDLAKLMKERKRDLAKQRGTRPKEYAEMVFIGAQRTDPSWNPDKATEWAEECLAWVRKRMPDSPVVAAAAHHDETQWHAHVIVVPRAVANGKMQWGTAAVHRAMDAEYTGTYRQRIGRRSIGAVMSRIQDDVWEHVGAPFGLLRGKVGSKRRHKAVDIVESANAHRRESRVFATRIQQGTVKLRKEAAERLAEVKTREEVQDERERSTDFERQRAELEADKEEHRREVAEDDERLRQREAELAKGQAQVERQAKANADDDERLESVRRKLESVRRKLESWEARLKAEDTKAKALLEEAAELKADAIEDAQRAIDDANAAAEAVREQEAAKLEAALRRIRRRNAQSRLAHHILKRCRNADMTDLGDQVIVDEFEADFSAALEPSTPAAKLRELAAKHDFGLKGSGAKRAVPDKTTATERDANVVDFPTR